MMHFEPFVLRSLAAIAVLAMTSPAMASGPRTEVPIHEVDLPDGARRYTVELQVGGRTIVAGLDTGSTGLRALSRALDPAESGAKGESVSYAYSSGTKFEGKAIRGSVAIGGAAGQVRLMRIDSVGCVHEGECPAAKVTPERFGIQGDGIAGQGFDAILGTSLRQDSVDNPLAQLGVTRWIVELPRPGNPAPGRLVLNPGDSELAGYRRIALVGDRDRMVGCVVGPEAQGKVCGLVLFDSGAPGIRIETGRGFAPWPQGVPATLAIGDSKGQAAMTVHIGRRDEGSAMFVATEPSLPTPRISLGIAPYFHWSVLYDAQAHEIGLRDRQ